MSGAKPSTTSARSSTDPRLVDYLIALGEQMLRRESLVIETDGGETIFAGTSLTRLRKLAKLAIRAGHPELAKERFVQQIEQIIGLEWESYRRARTQKNAPDAVAAARGENQHPTTTKEN